VLVDADTLVRQSLYIPRREARRWLHVPIEQEELVADGVEGLVRAAKRFDPKRGIPFAAFALMYVRGAILDTIRHRARRNATRDGGFFDTVSLDETTEDGLSARRSVVDPRPGPDEMVVHLERLRLIAGLPPRERYVLLRTQVDGASAEEVGAELGCGASRVHTLSAYGKARLQRRAAA
jgi:RNA polymerase sigma factor (sigma-70 family)